MRVFRTLVGMAALLLAVVVPATASAQIKLEKSDPGDGTQNASAPTILRFTFSELPDGLHSRFRLTDSAGYVVYLGTPKGFDNDGRNVAVPIAGRLTAGLYHVEWATVGADSVPASGKISFHVLSDTTSSSAGGIDSSALASFDVKVVPVVRPDEDNGSAASVVYSTARFLSSTALIIIMGAAVFRFGVVTRTRMRGGKAADAQIEAAMILPGLIAAGVFLFVAPIRLFLQHRIMVAGLGGAVGGLNIGFMGLSTRFGTVWMIQCSLVSLALVGFLLARWRIPGGWVVIAGSSVFLALASPFAGHAGATQQSKVSSIIFAAVHLVGVVGWLGTLFWLSVAALPVLRRSGEARARRVSDLVQVFMPIALISSAIMILSGVISGWLRLASLSALWSTSYGIALIVKLAVVLVVAAVSDYDWSQAKPALGRRGASAKLAKTVRVELVIGVIVVLVTAVLAGLPSPSR
jgi:putative copper export protein/methionine-rich copper-binding protein CopC